MFVAWNLEIGRVLFGFLWLFDGVGLWFFFADVVSIFCLFMSLTREWDGFRLVTLVTLLLVCDWFGKLERVGSINPKWYGW